MPGILLVSIDPEEGKVWQYALQQHGYETRLVTSLSHAIPSFAETVHSLVIVDVFDPLETVIPTLKQLPTHTATPILLMIPQRDEPYIVQAIEAGADDYLVKPVGLRLFLAKVSVWLFRSGATFPEPTPLVRAGDLELCPCEHRVTIGDTPIKLTPLEFRVLNLLMHHHGQILSKEILVSRVWGYTDSADGNLLKYVIHRLRRKIEPDPKHPCYIHTVPGEGYMFDPCTSYSELQNRNQNRDFAADYN